MKTIYYTAAGGVVFDKNQVLILHRPKSNDIRLPKGEIECGESPREAALREVTEETGYVDLEIIRDLGQQTASFEYKDECVHRNDHYFLMQLRSTRQIERLATEAHLAPVWTSWEDALNTLSYKEERRWLIEARKDLGQNTDENLSL